MAAATPSDSSDTIELATTHQHNPHDHDDHKAEPDVDRAYLASKGFRRFFRSVLFQIILFGCISFVGPSIFDAISNLGGGGLSTPYLANLATTLNYVSGSLVTLFGGPLINKIGIKWSSFIASLAFPLVGSGYYLSARYGVDWYLLVVTTINGLTAGFLYVSSTTAMQTYPDQRDRGWYLGMWSAMMNSGAVVGGIINFVINYRRSGAGGVAWFTYLIFLGLECTGFIWALLLSPTARVRRKDGTRPDLSGRNVTWKGELEALWAHARQKTSWLVFVPAFYSFFYGGTMGTYLTLHFSVRARALSTMVTPMCTIPMVMVYGKLLDMQRWSQRTRAWMALCSWVLPQAASFVWLGVEYHKLGTSTSTGLDPVLDSRRWAEAYLPFLIMFTTGYWTQLSLYWILGTFASDVKSTARSTGLFRAFTTCGMAVSYGLNSDASLDPRVPLSVNAALIALVLPCMIALIRLVPEKIDIRLEERLEKTSA
ncbi:UNC93-like protein 2 [Colletotrichum trifolii]|uniref:UNC93-like protein 2 n=1 Tax=Colletotrichum trifolii TaxID=5466 RepID=A0A4R8Q4H8_COLTR|nr:UNC93-like protein 2 [Colletotrichum trifolii]